MFKKNEKMHAGQPSILLEEAEGAETGEGEVEEVGEVEKEVEERDEDEDGNEEELEPESDGGGGEMPVVEVADNSGIGSKEGR